MLIEIQGDIIHIKRKKQDMNKKHLGRNKRH